jgi:hypothetical protein
MLNETDLAAEIRRRAALIAAPDDLLPTFDRTTDGGRAHIEVDDRYHYVVVERGVELERHATRDLDALLYRVFDAVASSMAWLYELHHRREGEDPRRQGFARQLDLLRTLDPAWAARREAVLAATLRKHPFQDG